MISSRNLLLEPIDCQQVLLILMSKQRNRAYLYLILAAFIWGAAAPIIKFTLEGIDPIPFLAYRFGIAAIFSSLFFIAKIIKGKKFHQLKKHFKLALIYGILAVPLGLGVLFFGLDKTTVLDLSLIGAIGPLVVLLGGSLFFHDHITSREKKGIFIVLLGVFINTFVPIFTTSNSIQFSGNLLLFIYLLSDAGSILVAKRAVKNKIKSSNLINMAFILGALIFIPLAFLEYGSKELLFTISHLPLKYHVGIWYMALISGNLAYFLLVRAQRTIETSEAALFSYMQPIFMIPLAIFWLHESLNPYFIFGAVLIAAGLYIAETKKPHKTAANPSLPAKKDLV